MTKRGSPGAAGWPRIRWRGLIWPALAGFSFGYVVLHPVSMVIFQWLDPRLAAGLAHGGGGGVWGPITRSFHFNMLPMGLVFGAIGASITTFYGFHRRTLAAQRDRLTEQTELLRRNNEELARLELASRRTSQFMAHDFKTGLGVIAGLATHLLEQPRLREDAEAVSALACIRRQAHKMMGSVTDLLEFARVRERRQPRMKPTTAAGLLEEAVSDFSLPAHTERITLGEHYSGCPGLLADARLLRRVLCNLISNAIKHNGPDTHVWLDAQVAESHREIRFSCCDDGAGIPPDVAPSIFTEFVGGSDSPGESSGLGLAFCKAVVEAHGGRIWCESTPRQGARFHFTIPLPKEPENGQ